MGYERVLRRPRVRAPGLVGDGWLNTGGRPLRAADLRGRVVLLDFWTSACVNCLHVIDELRPLEERFGAELVTIGVHSPKFAHEHDPAAVRDAVERYGVRHPVLADPDHVNWQAYTAGAWPTLVVVDPEGYVVAQVAGEGHGPALEALIAELLEEHRAKGTLHAAGALAAAPAPEPATALRFPAAVLPLPGGGWLVADAGRHSLALLGDDLETVTARIGAGGRGLRDGGPGEARFSGPQGLGLLPPDVAAAAGYDVVVADTGNHALRGVRLADRSVVTVAGTGRPRRTLTPVGDEGAALELDLSTPWDVAWFEDRLAVAMAGVHQLWWFDPRTGRAGVLAGTGHEERFDGPAAEAWFAQPSALLADGGTLWVADAETSSLRRLHRDPAAGLVVTTAVGQGLFDFGHRDGPAAQALLQHPLGLGALPGGAVAIADTYDGAIRRYDPATREVTTLARDLAEPAGLLLDGDALVVAESAAHRLVRLPLGAAGDAHPAVALAPEATLTVRFEPQPGQHLDDRFGDPTRLDVVARPAGLLVAGAGPAPGLTRELVLDGDGEGTLEITAQAASCDDTVCVVTRHTWTVAVTTATAGVADLALDLRPG